LILGLVNEGFYVAQNGKMMWDIGRQRKEYFPKAIEENRERYRTIGSVWAEIRFQILHSKKKGSQPLYSNLRKVYLTKGSSRYSLYVRR
jgi:hypothetical protein